jgi:hypothetical protein
MRKDIFEIKKELENLPETKLFKNIISLKSTISIFEGNTNELIELLNKINLIPIDYFMNNRREGSLSLEATKNIFEVKRLLHNFVSSVYTLVDNTRAFYQIYRRTWGHKFQDFEKEKQRWFENHGLSRFFYDLRKYFQHYKVPRIGFSFSYAHDTNVQINLLKDDLLEFKEWSQTGKIFLLKQDSQIHIYPLIIEYTKYVNEFYNWFINKLNYVHTDEKKKIKQKKQEYSNAALEELPLFLNMMLRLYREGQIKKPEKIFEMFFYEEDFENILEHYLDYEQRGEKFIKMIEKIYPSIHETFKIEIRRIFKEYKSKILEEEKILQ